MEATLHPKRKPAADSESAVRRIPLWIFRCTALVACLMMFFPPVNPGRISVKINESVSLFTSAVSYGTVTNAMGRILRDGWIRSSDMTVLQLSCCVILLGLLGCGAGACMSLGNSRMRRTGLIFPLIGAPAVGLGLYLIRNTYDTVYAHAEEMNKLGKVGMNLPSGLTVFLVTACLLFLSALLSFLTVPRPADSHEKMEMEEKYRLFLMLLPMILLAFVFCYLPIWGWRYALFDYKPGDALTAANYVGFKWFSFLFTDPATAADLVRVLRNTLVMSGLGIATGWLPIAFAVLLAEVRSSKFQRVVQTLTTIPNFISWVLVYGLAFAIFSTDGFINNLLRLFGGSANTNYLQSSDGIWLKMLLWGTWKGVGWSAIVYIAGIAGIDQQLYEAAKVDGANRFHCIWHITVPGLIPTYCVLLLMSVAGILSNGMEQYLVFSNAMNKNTIEVLDLYVYNLGIGSNQISLSTVVGISKSLVGVVLLFGANSISRSIRGESIV